MPSKLSLNSLNISKIVYNSSFITAAIITSNDSFPSSFLSFTTSYENVYWSSFKDIISYISWLIIPSKSLGLTLDILFDFISTSLVFRQSTAFLAFHLSNFKASLSRLYLSFASRGTSSLDKTIYFLILYFSFLLLYDPSTIET